MGEKLVLDLETQREFSEVQGRKPELLGVSVAGIYSYETDKYDAYVEQDIPKLAGRLRVAGLIIGFNIRRFDMPVIQPYLPFSVATLPILDIMEDVVKNLGHRLSLDCIAQATLGQGKSASGLDALRWFKQGRIDLIAKYCLDDVRITKEVYDYGKQHGRLFATSRFSEDKIQIPVFWPERRHDMGVVMKMLSEALEKRLQVEISYLSKEARPGQSPHTVRRVDIYNIEDPYFEGYCHLRNAVRQFRIDRVLDIKPTWQRYAIPEDFVPTAIGG